MKYTFSVLLIALLSFSSLFGQFDLFDKSTSVGGYGELHYNYSKPDGKEATKTLDFHRFVLFYSHAWTEEWSFKAEVELEHNFVSDGEGELELEQAFVQYQPAEYFGFQAGVILPSVGMLNEMHEPPTFLSVERPSYHKSIIPTTWFGNGLSLFGYYKGFDYMVSIMEGLNADNFSEKGGIRSGRQKGYKSNAEDFLYNFRLDYKGISGLKIGASYTYNNASGDSLEIPINLIELHARYRKHNIYFDFEYGNISYDNSQLEKSNGYYFDLGYNIGSLLGWKSELIPFFRYTDYNTAASVAGGGNGEKAYHNSKWMIGAAFKPIEEVVFKVDYSENEVELNSAKTQLFNIGVGYMF